MAIGILRTVLLKQRAAVGTLVHQSWAPNGIRSKLKWEKGGKFNNNNHIMLNKGGERQGGRKGERENGWGTYLDIVWSRSSRLLR